MKLERKSDHIKVLEHTGLSDSRSRDFGIRCSGCKERYQMIRKQGDNNNLQCMNCGTITPIRTIKRTRELTGPNIQDLNQIAIVQSKQPNFRGKDRMPKGVNSDKNKNPLVESLINRGYTIIDSQVDEPARATP